MALSEKKQEVNHKGKGRVLVMANYKKYGFCGVVPKPYTRSELAEVLNNIFC